MLKAFALCTLFSFALSPAASAEPIVLKLAFFTSDNSILYNAGVKPFVEAVNAEAKGLIEIGVFFSGALGKVPAQQPQLVSDGVADLAYIIPGYTPERFPDSTVIELPGLFQDSHEASLVYTHLLAAQALKGYEDLVVLGAYTSEAESIHLRSPVNSLADLKGLKIRTNNAVEAKVIEGLGMQPAEMAVNLVTDGISRGTLDGAMVPPAMLFEFGIGRVASYHYLLRTSTVPLALVMNRKKFESLPVRAQAIIREYSGEWALAQYNASIDPVIGRIMRQLKADPRRKVIDPSQPDLETAQAVFKSVTAGWVAESSHNRELLSMVEAELEKIRSAP